MRLSWLLGLPAVAYLAWLTAHAAAELDEAYVVTGLERTYLPPYETDDYYVIDNRPGPLLEEVRRRFAPKAAPRPEPADEAGWVAALGALGIRAQAGPGQAATKPIRLEWLADGPVLVLGTFNRQPLLFHPGLGVVLAKRPTLGPQNRALRLPDARERPW